jgi:hypothetical protein
MRTHIFKEPLRDAADIPVAGVTLVELLGEPGTVADVSALIDRSPRRDLLIELLKTCDEIRRFRTPGWTWQAMGGLEGWVAMRSGKALFWIVTKMN